MTNPVQWRNPTLFFMLAVTATIAGAEGNLQRFEFAQRHMGVTFGLVFYAPDVTAAEEAADAVFKRIEQLESIMSDYDAESEISRLARQPAGTSLTISRDLCRVLDHGQNLSARSKGAFDVTVGPYTRLWRRAKRLKELPSKRRLEQARSLVGFEKLKVDAKQQQVTLATDGMRLDLGGIAKGYAADEALRTLTAYGIRQALVDASGDIALGDPPPGKDGWRIGVAPVEANSPPSRTLTLANCAVATSGDAFQFTEINGRRYSHIIDPGTGLGLTKRSSVTTIAPTCMTADALASAISVLGPEKGCQLADDTAKASTLVVTVEDDMPRVHSSKRFPAANAGGDSSPQP